MSENQEEKKVSKGRKALRLTGFILGGLFGFIIVLLAVVLLLRNIIVEQAVERVAPLVTGTPVEIDHFSSNLFTGEVVLKGFKIGNPSGYVEPHGIVLDTLRVKLPPGTLLKEKIVIEEIFIAGVGINFELKANGDSNLTDIQKNVDAFTKSIAPQSGKKQEAAPEPEKKENAPKKQVVIAKLRQEQGFISTSIALTNSTMKIPLPAVEMTDVGGGSSLGETISVVFSEMMASVANGLSSAGLNMKNLKGLSDSVLKGLSDGGNIVLKGGEKGTTIVIEGASDTGKAIVDGVNSLFKKTKKEIKK